MFPKDGVLSKSGMYTIYFVVDRGETREAKDVGAEATDKLQAVAVLPSVCGSLKLQRERRWVLVRGVWLGWRDVKVWVVKS